MTLSELQALRSALYTGYLAWVTAGCPQSYTINGRSLTKVTGDFWLDQINKLDAQISRLGAGSCAVMQARPPE
jgi:hypothetical protein